MRELLKARGLALAAVRRNCRASNRAFDPMPPETSAGLRACGNQPRRRSDGMVTGGVHADVETPVGRMWCSGRIYDGNFSLPEDACMTEGLSLMRRVLRVRSSLAAIRSPACRFCAPKWKFQQSWQVPEGR